MSKLKITTSSGNVFTDLGFDAAEAELLRLRSALMIELGQHIASMNMTQTETARLLKTTQARVSRLVRGRFADFSLDSLVTLAQRAGLHVEMKLAA